MINRDPAFWDSVAQHPQVAPHVFMGRATSSLAGLVEHPGVLPLASENGGVLFVGIDPLGMVREMHTMYKPEGWGREVALFGRKFIEEAFKVCSLITTNEQEGHWRSLPPKSHGWVSSGEFREVGLSKRVRLWLLTREAWVASPVGRKMQCQ